MQVKEIVDIKAIDGGIGDRGTFFKQYSNKWYIKMFCNREHPSIRMLFIIGYLPAIALTVLAVLSRPKIISPIKNNIDLNHTNVIDIAYWSNIKGIDAYCSPGTQTRYFLNMSLTI